MEQKIVEKMEMAIKLFEEKVEKFNYDAKIFCEEIFTKDIRKMLEVIKDSMRCDYYYRIKINGTAYKIIIHDLLGVYTVKYDSRIVDDKIFASHIFKYCLDEFSIDDRGLEHLKSQTYELENYIKWLHIIQDNAEDIIEDITSEYKKRTEEQNDKVDTVLELLGAEYEPTKHIKVTVEWL